MPRKAAVDEHCIRAAVPRKAAVVEHCIRAAVPQGNAVAHTAREGSAMPNADLQQSAAAALQELRQLQRCSTRWSKRRLDRVEQSENYDPSAAVAAVLAPVQRAKQERRETAQRVRKTFVKASTTEKERARARKVQRGRAKRIQSHRKKVKKKQRRAERKEELPV